MSTTLVVPDGPDTRARFRSIPVHPAKEVVEAAESGAAMSAVIRIVIVEKQRFLADALGALMSSQPGMVVVGNVSSVAEFAPHAAQLHPDIVIMNFRRADQAAAAALMTIFETSAQAKVIFLTSEESDEVVLAAIEAGASAVLNLSCAADEVVNTVRSVAGGGVVISTHKIAMLLEGRRKADVVRDKLTTREMQVLGLMAGGTSNRGIATTLCISYTTVRCHVRNLSGKLSAHSKLEVLVKAHQLDLIDRRAATRAIRSTIAQNL